MKCPYTLFFVSIFGLLSMNMVISLPGNANESDQKSRSFTTQLAQKDPVNLILYEARGAETYAAVAYMPYYPAYGMVTLKTPTCRAELTGFVDPFLLQKNQLSITYKKCKITFQQNKQTLDHPKETEICQNFHPKECNFDKIPTLSNVNLSLYEE